MTYNKGKRDTWQIFYGTTYDYTNEAYCILVVPPSNMTITGDQKNGGIYRILYSMYKKWNV